jgi:hypothetical protein
MTFSSASVSACDVDAVAATAAAATGFRAGAGGKAACWRVAGPITGAAVEVGAAFLAVVFAAGAVVLAGVLAAGAVFLASVLAVVLGTTLRAIGRGAGSGTLDSAQASAVNADMATASAKVTSVLLPKAVCRNADLKANGVTVLLRGESFYR